MVQQQTREGQTKRTSFSNRCINLMQDASQITYIALHEAREHGEHEMLRSVLKCYEDAANNLDRTALHLKYDTKFEEHEALLESFRRIIDGEQSTERLRDNLRADTYELSKFLEEFEKRIISVIDMAYKYSSLKPTAAASISKNLTMLAEHIKDETEDVLQAMYDLGMLDE